MKKKGWIWMVSLPAAIALLVMLGTVFPGFKPGIGAEAAVLLDVESGQNWIEQNSGRPLPAAGMAKLMTQLLVLDDIASGAVRWDDRVMIGEAPLAAPGLKLSLRYGETFTVRELFEGLCVYSANDAAVALAEHLAGSEGAFVIRMNERAREMGLSPEVELIGSSGFRLRGAQSGAEPEGDILGNVSVMSANDAARIAARLVSDHPEVLVYSSRTQMQLKNKGLYLSNNNHMLPAMGGAYAYSGTDGLKTGYDGASGYCITVTAERGNRRMIAVVLGADSPQSRYEGAAQMLDYGFKRAGES